MSLSEDVRSELAAIEPRRACCRLAELSALVRGAGSVHYRGGGEVAVHVDLGSAAGARRTFALLRGSGSAPRSGRTVSARSRASTATSSIPAPTRGCCRP